MQSSSRIKPLITFQDLDVTFFSTKKLCGTLGVEAPPTAHFLLLPHSTEATKTPARFPTQPAGFSEPEAGSRAPGRCHSCSIPRGAQGVCAESQCQPHLFAANTRGTDQTEPAPLTPRLRTGVADD